MRQPSRTAIAVLSLLGAVNLGELGLGLFLFFLCRPLPHAVPEQYGAVLSFVAVGLITAWELAHGRANGAG